MRTSLRPLTPPPLPPLVILVGRAPGLCAHHELRAGDPAVLRAGAAGQRPRRELPEDQQARAVAALLLRRVAPTGARPPPAPCRLLSLLEGWASCRRFKQLPRNASRSICGTCQIIIVDVDPGSIGYMRIYVVSSVKVAMLVQKATAAAPG